MKIFLPLFTAFVLVSGCSHFNLGYQKEVAEDTLETIVKDEFQGVDAKSQK